MRIVWSLFPKFYRQLGLGELADLVRKVGLDATNMVIRDGYWVTPDNLATETKTFVEAMRRNGLTVHFATAGFAPADVLKDDTPLAVLADNGIREFRLGYYPQCTGAVAAALETARAEMERIARICERRGIRAVYQVHHGTLVTNSVQAWLLVRDLSPEWLGIMLDPGNQAHEGWESWRQAGGLLGEHWVAAGIKDVAWQHDADKAGEPGKGWSRKPVPLQEGVVNWRGFAEALRAVDFDGTFVFMPFYNIREPALMTANLEQEVAYLRRIVQDA